MIARDKGFAYGHQVNIVVNIPDTLAVKLGTKADLPRRAVEALALDAYRAGRLSKPELRGLLGLTSRYEMDGFLKAHGVYEDFSVDEIEEQIQAVERLGF